MLEYCVIGWKLVNGKRRPMVVFKDQSAHQSFRVRDNLRQRGGECDGLYFVDVYQDGAFLEHTSVIEAHHF